MRAPYILYKISEWLARTIPRSWAYRLGWVISTSVLFASHRERRAVKRNLCRLHKISCHHPSINKKVREIYRNFSRYYVDLLYDGRKGSRFLDQVDGAGYEVIDRVLAKGKGAVVLSAHVGNWELGAMAIAAKKYPVSAIAHQHKDPRVDRFFVERRMVFGLRVIPTAHAVRQALRRLKGNELVAINGDRRYFSDGGAPVRFFGGNALIPRGPAYLSFKSGAGIVGARLVPEGSSGRFRMFFSGPLYPEKFTMEEYIQKTADLMEPMILTHPAYWFAFEDIWKIENKYADGEVALL